MIEQKVDVLKITENEYTNIVLDKDGLVFSKFNEEDGTNGYCGIIGNRYDVKNYTSRYSAHAKDSVCNSIKSVYIQTDLNNIDEDFISIGHERSSRDDFYSSSSKYFSNKIKHSGVSLFEGTSYACNYIAQSDEVIEINCNESDVFHVLISDEVNASVMSIRLVNAGEPFHYKKEIFITNMSTSVNSINLIGFGEKKNTKNFVYNIKYTNKVEYRNIFRGSINGDSGRYEYYKINEF